MSKIHSVQLANFRGFRDSGVINFAPLTFLVGPNSSGKSSLADAALLVSQSTQQTIFWTNPEWMGRLIDLGSYRDVVYKHTIQRAITISLVVEVGLWPLRVNSTQRTKSEKPKLNFCWQLKNDPKSEAGRLHSLTVTDVTSGVDVTLTNLVSDFAIKFDGRTVRVSKIMTEPFMVGHHIYKAIFNFINSGRAIRGTKAAYGRIAEAFVSPEYRFFFSWMERVSSARSGPKRWVAKSSMQNLDEYQFGLLDDPYKMILEPPPNSRVRSRRKVQPTESVAKYLEKLGIASEISRHDLSAYHGALRVKDNVSSVVSNLADVGFGASQAIPVIRGCIGDNEAPIFLEQPEIHLHPKAQSELAALICATSRRRQVIVETHSEHMINKARIMVAEGQIKPQDVIILYVDRKKTGSHITEIGIDSSGDFTENWPSGFFDERYQDSLRLMEIKSRNSEVIVLPVKKQSRTKNRPE